MKRGGGLRFTAGALAAAIPAIFLLGPTVISSDTFAFRDIAHFYRPLYEFVNNANFFRPPLWNAYDNLGTPVADEATSAVFYPGRLILHIPVESFALRLEIYILVHAVLASVGGYWLARLWRCSHPAAIIAGMAYGCGGGVIFQYCNVVFLVGAAWLPFAIGAGERLLTQRNFFWGVFAGMCLALMTLGGDAQAAYIAVLVLGLLAVIDFVSYGRKSQVAPAVRWKNAFARFATSTTLIIGVAMVGGLLAAPQVWCSFFAAQNSPRLQYDQPRTVWEIAHHAMRPTADSPSPPWKGVIDPPQPGSHQAAMVDFSVAPWHWAEFVWPRFSGSLFPRFRRWVFAIPSEDRVWTPSLYFGLLPFLLAVCAVCSQSRTRREYWLKVTAIVALLTCLGWYGAGWIVNEIHHTFSTDHNESEILSPAFGGLYWLFSVVLPGFIGFRYPAKFLVIATLALSVLAARSYDNMRRSRKTTVSKLIIGVIVASVLLVIVAAILGFGFAETWRNLVLPDDSFGPFDVSGAAWEVIGSALLATILSIALLLTLHRRHKIKSATFASLVLAIVACDLCISQYPLIATAPESSFVSELASDTMVLWSGSSTSARPYAHRLHGDRLQKSWKKKSSHNRIAEIADRERAVGFGRHNLPSGGRPGAPMLDTFLSVRSTDHLVFFDTVAEYTVQADSERPKEIGQLLNWLETPPATNQPQSIEPLVFVVFRAERFPVLKSRKISDIIRRTEATIFPAGAPCDFTQSASIECETDPELAAVRPKLAEVMVLSHTAEEITLSANLGAKGLIVVRQSYDSNWRVSAVSSNNTTITPELIRTNRVLQGFVLPAGEWRVKLRYEPTSLKISFWVSLGCWVSALLLLLLQPLRPLIRQRLFDLGKTATY